MQAYRAAILRFADDGSAVYEQDGLLVVGPDADGAGGAGRRRLFGLGAQLTRASRSSTCPARILAPGFIDLHIHFPQIDVIGSPAAGLLPWLENYTFPHESRFSDAAHCTRTGHASSSTNCCATA